MAEFEIINDEDMPLRSKRSQLWDALRAGNAVAIKEGDFRSIRGNAHTLANRAGFRAKTVKKDDVLYIKWEKRDDSETVDPV